MNISRETATLCLGLLAQVQLSATDPDLQAKVAQVVQAREELAHAAAAPDVEPDGGVNDGLGRWRPGGADLHAS
jgi:hypothetical protein